MKSFRGLLNGIIPKEILDLLSNRIAQAIGNFDVYHTLFKRYREIFQALFDYDPIAPSKAGFGEIEKYPEKVLRFGWILFLLMHGTFCH
jgi:hypothetical protein